MIKPDPRQDDHAGRTVGQATGRRYNGGARDDPGTSLRGCSRHAISGTTPVSSWEKALSWIILLVAGLFEIVWAIGLKYTEGFTRLWPTVGTVLAMIVSVALLGLAMKTLPVGTAYAVWTGVGAVGTVILGIVLLGEPVNAGRVISVGLIVAGIVGLKLVTD